MNKAENEERIKSHSDLGTREVLTGEQIAFEVDSILSNILYINNELILQDTLDSKKYAFYVGYTGRRVEEESCMFLTARGVRVKGGTSKSQKPVLTNSDGSVLNLKKLKKDGN
jgi:hypothetical protein